MFAHMPFDFTMSLENTKQKAHIKIKKAATSDENDRNSAETAPQLVTTEKILLVTTV